MALLAGPSRSHQARLHRRDLDQDQHGAAARLGTQRPAAARLFSIRSLAHIGLPGRATLRPAHRAVRLRWADQWPELPGLYRAAARADFEAR